MIYQKFTNSSQLFSASYYEEEKSLVIKFMKGYSYKYFEVQKDIFLALCEAESAGSFFNKNIAKKFTYERI